MIHLLPRRILENPSKANDGLNNEQRNIINKSKTNTIYSCQRIRMFFIFNICNGIDE